MEVKNAKDYIEILDAAGEDWSNDNDALADAMEDYAKMYHEQQVKNCDLADVVGQNEQYHCELYDFGRQKKRCEKQCDSCKWMEEKQ